MWWSCIILLLFGVLCLIIALSIDNVIMELLLMTFSIIFILYGAYTFIDTITYLDDVQIAIEKDEFPSENIYTLKGNVIGYDYPYIYLKK